jgi:hypothetical protein
MKHQQYNEHQLESAWQEVEIEIKASGIVAPVPGFVRRWQERLALYRKKIERRQAWFIVALCAVIAFGFLSLIGLFSAPKLATSPDNLFYSWVGLLSRIIIFIKMVGGLAETIVRSLQVLIPVSGWVAIGFGVIGLFVLWAFMVRRFGKNIGVDK